MKESSEKGIRRQGTKTDDGREGPVGAWEQGVAGLKPEVKDLCFGCQGVDCEDEATSRGEKHCQTQGIRWSLF